MADESSSIFNKKATAKLRSPDDLDKYVRVANPSVWVALAACVVFLAGMLFWGVLGAVTTSVTAMGSCIDGQAMCFLSTEDASKVEVGDEATVGGETMKVASVSTVPFSRGEASAIIKSDYLSDTLVKGDWACQVLFDGDTSDLTPNVPVKVSITVDRVSPISLILGSITGGNS